MNRQAIIDEIEQEIKLAKADANRHFKRIQVLEHQLLLDVPGTMQKEEDKK
jgi:hypothetical protein